MFRVEFHKFLKSRLENLLRKLYPVYIARYFG